MADSQENSTPALFIGGHNILCPHNCGFVASGAREWIAIHRLGEHLITAHVSPLWTRPQPVQKAS